MDEERIAVLIVEDNLGDARLIEHELQHASASFTTEHAERLSEGLEALRRASFDVVLLDLSLPDSHGLTTVERLEAEAPELPILVLTGLEDEKVGMQAVRAGAQDYLVKGTFDADRLETAMRYAIERKEVSREVAELRQQLAMSEKLSTLGALVSGLASELRTSNTYITNTLFQVRQRLQDEAAKDPALGELAGDVGEHIARAMDGVDRIDRLVRDLRGFTQRGSASAAKLGLDGPASEAVDIFRATHRSKVTVEADLAPTMPLALDPIQVQQVVLNLLANAAEAMPDGGTIKVRTREVPGGAELVVADEGHGLTADARRRLFEPFYTTKPASAGLGLSIARRIVDAHHGSIQVDSEAGRGSTFIVFLPDRTDRDAHAGKAEA